VTHTLQTGRSRLTRSVRRAECPTTELGLEAQHTAEVSDPSCEHRKRKNGNVGN
jgi:hypothetical protein